MSDRFHSPQSLIPGALIFLPADEARHLRQVLRVNVGESIVVFDGRGSEADAVVERADRKEVLVRLAGPVRTEPAPPQTLWVAVAPPKGDRFRWLIEKSVELGIDRLIPLETARSVVEPGERKLERMEQVVISACKQCGRNRLMELSRVTTWESFLEGLQSPHAIPVAAQSGGNVGSESPLLLLAAPGGLPLGQYAIRSRNDKPPAKVVAMIGPEGGWTDRELAQAEEAGAVCVRLGSFIQRIETAVLTIAAWHGLMIREPRAPSIAPLIQ